MNDFERKYSPETQEKLEKDELREILAIDGTRIDCPRPEYKDTRIDTGCWNASTKIFCPCAYRFLFHIKDGNRHIEGVLCSYPKKI